LNLIVEKKRAEIIVDEVEKSSNSGGSVTLSRSRLAKPEE